MAWADKLYTASYTAPSGASIEFKYTEVRSDQSSRGTAWNFVDADGTYAQRTGMGGRRFPMVCIFSGSDYEVDADNFLAALAEQGDGELVLPLYGSIKAVPLDDIRRRDQLVTGANQCTVQVTFYETTGLVYPSTTSDAGTSFTSSLDTAQSDIADATESDLVFDSVTEQSNFTTRYTSTLSVVKSAIGSIADTEASIQRTFNRSFEQVSDAVETLVADPINLVLNTQQLIEYPARAASTISARLDGYSNLCDDVFGSDASDRSDYQVASVVGPATILAMADAGVAAASEEPTSATGFATRSTAVSYAANLIDQYFAYANYRDTAQQSFEDSTKPLPTDSGAALQTLGDAVALAAGAIIEASFTLAQARYYQVTSRTTILNLCAKLYGDVSNDTLDRLIATNDLPGDRILELQIGDEVLYYA